MRDYVGEVIKAFYDVKQSKRQQGLGYKLDAVLRFEAVIHRLVSLHCFEACSGIRL